MDMNMNMYKSIMDVRNERPKEGDKRGRGRGREEVRRELLVMRDRGGCKERGSR